MRWLAIFLLAAAAGYLALDNVRLRGELAREARARAGEPVPTPHGRRAAASSRTAEPRAPWRARPRAVAPLAPTRADADAMLRGQALDFLDASREAAGGRLAAFAREAGLRPEQVGRARQVARDIADMLRASAGSIDSETGAARAGDALRDLQLLLREAEDRFTALLDPDQRAAYAASAFDFARDVLLLDDREPSPIEEMLNRAPPGAPPRAGP